MYEILGPILLLSAILFILGESLKRMGFDPHLLPLTLGLISVAVMVFRSYFYPLTVGYAMACFLGILSASLAVYGHQLVTQLGRDDRFQLPFRDFKFDKKGGGL